MAMTMIGEIQLAAPREAVWAKLNDPAAVSQRASSSRTGRTPATGFAPISWRY